MIKMTQVSRIFRRIHQNQRIRFSWLKVLGLMISGFALSACYVRPGTPGNPGTFVPSSLRATYTIPTTTGTTTPYIDFDIPDTGLSGNILMSNNPYPVVRLAAGSRVVNVTDQAQGLFLNNFGQIQGSTVRHLQGSGAPDEPVLSSINVNTSGTGVTGNVIGYNGTPWPFNVLRTASGPGYYDVSGTIGTLSVWGRVNSNGTFEGHLNGGSVMRFYSSYFDTTSFASDAGVVYVSNYQPANIGITLVGAMHMYIAYYYPR